MPAYIWVTELDNTQPNQVEIGATTDESYLNLVDAINALPSAVRGSPPAIVIPPGVEFSLPTRENAAFNASGPVGGVITVTAKIPGTIGNSYGLTETTSNFSWSGSHATGGSDGTTTPLTVGVQGAQAGPNLLYTRGSANISTSTPVATGTQLHVQYFRLGAEFIVLEDSALVSARAAIEGGNGKVHMLLSDTANTDPLSGTAEALQQLTQFKVFPEGMSFNTYLPGLQAGQFLTIAITKPLLLADLANGTWQIHQVTGQYQPGQQRFLYSVTVTSSTVASLISKWEAFTGK